MQTKVIKITEDNCDNSLKEAAEIIRSGGLVSFPTETVYGLGANGLDEKAVKRIYAAKGRPSDNPLILHISSLKELKPLVSEINKTAKTLIDNFWPGPMTLVFKKSDIVPLAISGGLDTVAVRFPVNEIARKLIAFSKVPIAAPSANTSGRPSPTKAEHVFEDLNGKIEMIIDGGSCDIGLESTVIDVTADMPVILRPGMVTIEEISKLFKDTSYDRHLTEKIPVSNPKSPGMKYKHYAPKGELFILDGEADKIISYIKERYTKDTAVITFDEFPVPFENTYFMGSIENPIEGGEKIFDILRDCDFKGYKTIFAHIPKKQGVGFALFNRMSKAAAGRIIELE